jgi:hypothetical protein
MGQITRGWMVPLIAQPRICELWHVVLIVEQFSPDSSPRPTAAFRSKSTVCGLNGLRPASARGSSPFKSSTAMRSCSCGLFPWVASLRPKKYGTHHIFQSETELQNIAEAAPSSPSFSVSEKLARYGSSALSGVEHLRLLVGKDSIADALLRHFGLLRRCLEPRLKNCANSCQKERQRP